jgi:hypothetical protein
MYSYFLITFRLCGFPPFYDEDNDKLFQLIKSGTFTFPSPYWDSISNEGSFFGADIFFRKGLSLKIACDRSKKKDH